MLCIDVAITIYILDSNICTIDFIAAWVYHKIGGNTYTIKMVTTRIDRFLYRRGIYGPCPAFHSMISCMYIVGVDGGNTTLSMSRCISRIIDSAGWNLLKYERVIGSVSVSPTKLIALDSTTYNVCHGVRFYRRPSGVTTPPSLHVLR